MAICGITHPRTDPNGPYDRTECTLEAGHEGEHRSLQGPYWAYPMRGGDCRFRSKATGRRCALGRDHWEAHRDGDGWQFTVEEAVDAAEGCDEYRPRLRGEAALAARNDPIKPRGACCNNEQRGMNGGCGNCGDPCL